MTARVTGELGETIDVAHKVHRSDLPGVHTVGTVSVILTDGTDMGSATLSTINAAHLAAVLLTAGMHAEYTAGNDGSRWLRRMVAQIAATGEAP